jgi:hypothetical protein
MAIGRTRRTSLLQRREQFMVLWFGIHGTGFIHWVYFDVLCLVFKASRGYFEGALGSTSCIFQFGDKYHIVQKVCFSNW